MEPKKVLYKQYIHAKHGGANGRPLPGTGCWEDGYSIRFRLRAGATTTPNRPARMGGCSKLLLASGVEPGRADK